MITLIPKENIKPTIDNVLACNNVPPVAWGLLLKQFFNAEEASSLSPEVEKKIENKVELIVSKHSLTQEDGELFAQFLKKKWNTLNEMAAKCMFCLQPGGYREYCITQTVTVIKSKPDELDFSIVDPHGRKPNQRKARAKASRHRLDSVD